MKNRLFTWLPVSVLAAGMMLIVMPPQAKAWLVCNRAFYVQAGHQREVERLGGVADQQYLTAYNFANAALVKLEEAAKQDTLGNRAAELAAWDDGLNGCPPTPSASAGWLWWAGNRLRRCAPGSRPVPLRDALRAQPFSH